MDRLMTMPALMADRENSPPLSLCVTILGVVFAIMLGWTWLGWPDPTVDFGRELYVPWQLCQGKILYRDIAYFNGPLSPYFNALIFKLFGPSLRALIWTNLTLLALLTTLLFKLLSTTFCRCAALVGCLIQLTIFSFIQLAGVGNYNFITPYSHELTHGLLLSVATLLALCGVQPPSPGTRGEGGGEGPARGWKGEIRKWNCAQFLFNSLLSTLKFLQFRPSPRVKGKGGRFSILAGFLLGLTFLTKIEIFLALIVAIFVFLTLSTFARDAQRARSLSFRTAARNILCFNAAALVPPVLAFLLLHRVMPAHDAWIGVLGSWRYAFDPRLAANPFYRDLMGVSGLTTHLLHALSMFALDLFVLALLIALAVFAHTQWRALAIVATWLLAAAAYLTIDAQWWQTAFAGLPLLLALVWLIQLRTFSRDRSSAALSAIVFTTFALAMTAKIILNVRFSQYGFALGLPAALALIGFVFHNVRNKINRGGGGALFVQLCLPLVALMIAVHLRPYAQIFSRKPIVVGFGSDRFLVGDIRGVAVNRCLDQLRSLPPTATVAVVPEGVMINYLAKRVNPTEFINLMPPEVLMFGEASIHADFQSHPPDYIVFNDGSSPAEYGAGSFASDYGKAISDWIVANYQPMNNATIPPYPLRLLEHRRNSFR